MRFDVSLDAKGCTLTTKQLTAEPMAVACEPLRVCTGGSCQSAGFADGKLTFGTATCHGHF